MPSPFPGMDPCIESQAWEDFHHQLTAELHKALTACVRPRYVVRVEERLYVERMPGEATAPIRPDLAVTKQRGQDISSRGGTATAVVAVAPVPVRLLMPERIRETFLTIRKSPSLEVVAVLEVLSPGNKRPGGDGRREYLDKRQAVLQSPVHLVELDLLRGGERLPMAEPLPAGDYYAIVSRAERRPLAGVSAWSLRQSLPQLAIPLAGDDPDVEVDLQPIFSAVYEGAGYDYSLDHRLPVQPPLGDADAAWLREVVAANAAPAG